MSDTQNPPEAAPQEGIVQRIATPLFLFAGALLGLLLLSWLFLLPRFTRLNVTGTVLPPDELVTYARQLEIQVNTLEEQRDQFIVPVQDGRFAAVKAEKARYPSLLAVSQELQQLAVSAADNPDAVWFASIAVDYATGTVKVEGDVSGVGPRSMTVLAQFVEGIKELPFVASLTPPVFTREQGDDGKPYSPFSFHFTLNEKGERYPEPAEGRLPSGIQ